MKTVSIYDGTAGATNNGVGGQEIINSAGNNYYSTTFSENETIKIKTKGYGGSTEYMTIQYTKITN